MRSILLLGSVCLTLACGSGQSDVTTDTLTQREKDSILANSKIPNARAVGKAMRVADSTSARVLRADTVASDTTEH
jgi:hypothetical protein